MFSLRLFIFILSLLSYSSVAHVSNINEAYQKSKNNEQQLSNTRTKVDQIDAKIRQAEYELAFLKASLADLAKQTQAIASKLTKNSNIILENRKQIPIFEKKLYSLTLKYIALEKAPANAVILSNHPLEDIFRNYTINKGRIKTIQRDITSINRKLSILEIQEQEYAEDLDKLNNNKEDILQRQKNIQNLLNNQSSVKKEVNKTLQQIESEQDKTLKLIQKIEMAALEKVKLRRAAPSKQQFIAQEKGNILHPVAGEIIGRFNQKNIEETRQKGVSYKVEKDSDVIAPANGKVVFANALKGYGVIVILEHTDKHFSIISFLNSANVKVGDYLFKNDVIGKIKATDENHPPLYYEFRLASTPQNPEIWLKKRT